MRKNIDNYTWVFPVIVCIAYFLTAKNALPTIVYCFIAMLVSIYFLFRIYFFLDKSQKTLLKLLFICSNILFATILLASIPKIYALSSGGAECLTNTIKTMSFLCTVLTIYYLMWEKPKEEGAISFLFSFFGVLISSNYLINT